MITTQYTFVAHELPFRQTIEVPVGARLLSASAWGRTIRINAIANPESEMESREFVVYGDGQLVIEEPIDFLGSDRDDGGGELVHVFEVLKKERV